VFISSKLIASPACSYDAGHIAPNMQIAGLTRP